MSMMEAVGFERQVEGEGFIGDGRGGINGWNQYYHSHIIPYSLSLFCNAWNNRGGTWSYCERHQCVGSFGEEHFC